MPEVEPMNRVAVKKVTVRREINEVFQQCKRHAECGREDHSSPAPRTRWNQCAKAVTAIVIRAEKAYAIGRLIQTARLRRSGSSKIMSAPVQAMTAAPM